MNDAAEITIRDYRPEDRDAALQVLTAAFEDAPDVRMMVGSGPGASERLRFLNATALESDSKLHVMVAERNARIAGVLTWADLPDCSALSLRQIVALVRAVGPRLPATVRLLLKGSAAHPKTPHRHIPQVGVDPSAQNQGVGSALISHLCRQADEAGLPAYLETYVWSSGARPSLRDFYERFGFSVTREVPMNAAWSGIAMVRPVGATAR